jgi:hypothetical protein
MKGQNSGIKMGDYEGSILNIKVHRLRDFTVFVLIIPIISWSFSFMFAVKHSLRPTTKLTLVLLAKYRPYDVKMSHAMRIMVSVQYKYTSVLQYGLRAVTVVLLKI